MLLGCTYHTVIKSLGMNDRLYCHSEVGTVIDNYITVTRTYAECRSTGRISSVYHCFTAGCNDEINFLHHHIGDLE